MDLTSVQMKLHQLQFDELYTTLYGVGSIEALSVWYPDETTALKHIVLCGGQSEELLIIDSRARARIYSFAAQQMRCVPIDSLILGSIADCVTSKSIICTTSRSSFVGPLFTGRFLFLVRQQGRAGQPLTGLPLVKLRLYQWNITTDNTVALALMHPNLFRKAEYRLLPVAQPLGARDSISSSDHHT